MDIFILVVFILGYAFIALEHNIHIDKAASALVTGTVCWALFVLGWHDVPAHLAEEYPCSIGRGLARRRGPKERVWRPFLSTGCSITWRKSSSILFFLMGAMTIVELVDAHEGFRVITDRIQTRNKVKMLWIVCILTFFFSALLDNLTTSIVMVSLLRKLIDDRQTRWLFAGMVVIAANAGGAWSPIGDVTTTMLWIGGQLTTTTIIANLILAQRGVLACSPRCAERASSNGEIDRPVSDDEEEWDPTTRSSATLFGAGVAGLLFVPVFKTVTHLPTFYGHDAQFGGHCGCSRSAFTIPRTSKRKPTSLSLGCCAKLTRRRCCFSSASCWLWLPCRRRGICCFAADWLSTSLNDVYLIDLSIGLLSAIVDNVPSWLRVWACTTSFPRLR